VRGVPAYQEEKIKEVRYRLMHDSSAETSPVSVAAHASRVEYLLKVRTSVDQINYRLNLPAFFVTASDRERVMYYFMERAVQIGESVFRIRDLQMPIAVLARVLCEDFITMYFVSQSDENTAEYFEGSRTEMKKILSKMIENRRIKVRRISSGADVTAEFLPKLKDRISSKKTIKDIAQDTGLARLYDVVYRYESLEVHGNTFGFSDEKTVMDGVAAAISAVAAILRVVLVLADSKDRVVTSGEILTVLNIQHLKGT
jgi:Family of unknown function (DUF5677)